MSATHAVCDAGRPRAQDRHQRRGVAVGCGGGIVAGELRPAGADPELRELTRYRKTQIRERQREADGCTRVLEDAGIKLTGSRLIAREVRARDVRGA